MRLWENRKNLLPTLITPRRAHQSTRYEAIEWESLIDLSCEIIKVSVAYIWE